MGSGRTACLPVCDVEGRPGAWPSGASECHGTSVAGAVPEPFWWQPVCSPRAGGDVKRWGSPTGGSSYGRGCQAFVFPVSWSQASDPQGHSGMRMVPWPLLHPAPAPHVHRGGGLGAQGCLSSSHRHAGPWGQRGWAAWPLSAIWNLKPLQQTTWAIPAGRPCSARSSASRPSVWISADGFLSLFMLHL